MVRTDLCDQMAFEETTTDEISLSLASGSDRIVGRLFPLDRSNLIVKAAEALREFAGVRTGVRISVCKHIPAEAGLAGGSGNAATTLLSLNELWKLNLCTAQLHPIAAKLGSDVNFFVENTRAALCRGRGEQVSPIAMNGSLHVVAARPRSGNSTAAVFTALPAVTTTRTAEPLIDSLANVEPRDLTAHVFNRLTETARRQNPQMDALMSTMRFVTGRPVFMSGSGSTCFVIAESKREADVLRGRLHSLDVSFLEVLRI